MENKVRLPSSQAIWCNNLSTIALPINPIYHYLTKHVEMDLHFVKDRVLQNKLVVLHVPSHEQPIDIFTKPLSILQ